jgi:putative transcriptional regulator
MSNTGYMAYGQYLPHVVNMQLHTEPLMIVIKLDELLKHHERTFYWLAKETGISHTTLWRLKKDKALGINFDTLEKVCHALKCQPGDVLTVTKNRNGTRKGSKTQGRKP